MEDLLIKPILMGEPGVIQGSPRSSVRCLDWQTIFIQYWQHNLWLKMNCSAVALHSCAIDRGYMSVQQAPRGE